MANISKIVLPNGTTYNVKDTTARNRAETAKSVADTALNKANLAVPLSDALTTSEINEIWEAN
jgi:hypothetical protein